MQWNQPTVRGSELIIQVKKNKPNARFFFITELLVLFKRESPLEWKNKFFSFTQYLLSLDKKRSQNEDLHPAEAQFSSQRLTTLKTLSEKEIEIVNLLLSGSTISQSAIKLKISFHTVNNYVKRIYKKLGVRSRSELFSKIYINNYKYFQWMFYNLTLFKNECNSSSLSRFHQEIESAIHLLTAFLYTQISY